MTYQIQTKRKAHLLVFVASVFRGGLATEDLFTTLAWCFALAPTTQSMTTRTTLRIRAESRAHEQLRYKANDRVRINQNQIHLRAVYCRHTRDKLHRCVHVHEISNKAINMKSIRAVLSHLRGLAGTYCSHTVSTSLL